MYKAIGVLLAIFAGPTSAATVIVDGNNATSINDLDIGGISYDVTWERSTFEGINEVSDLSFLGDFDDAMTVVSSINAELTNAGVENAGGYAGFFIAYDDFGGSVTAIQSIRSVYPVANWFVSDDAFALAPTSSVTFAKFTVSAVPVPAAVWLFGSAIAGLGLLKRKQSSTP